MMVCFYVLEETFDFFFELFTSQSGYVAVKYEVDTRAVEVLEERLVHCGEGYAAVLDFAFSGFVQPGRKIAEVAFEAAQHVVLCAYVPAFENRQRQVIKRQSDERKELLVEAIIARQADAASDGGSDTQALLQVVVAIIERHKTVRSYAAIDVHSAMRF